MSELDDLLTKHINTTDGKFVPLPDVRRSDGSTYQNIPLEEYRRALAAGEGDVESALLKHEDDVPVSSMYHHTYENGEHRQWKLKRSFPTS